LGDSLAFFVITLVGHWVFGWFRYVDEQEEQPVEIAGYLIETSRDTLAKWQSQLLQLIGQVARLSSSYA
jgi:hypothetical protein